MFWEIFNRQNTHEEYMVIRKQHINDEDRIYRLSHFRSGR